MHPYESLDEKFFWSSAVAKRSLFDIDGLWVPKFDISKTMKVATFGSCFAQHIGKSLAARGFNWFITEPPPQGLSPQNAAKFNYGVFSARTGNIYTTSLLKQWVEWSCEGKPIPNEVWEKDGRFFDPFRPNIEPNGFESIDELHRSRAAATDSFRDACCDSDIFVFTLGLTESWGNSELGHEYPMCPGTICGDFNPDQHHFYNQNYPFIRNSLTKAINSIKKLNPDIKFILTVSPVPLTATMSGNHVLVATTESKSILRAVAGEIQRQFDFVDYFPSYEIINSAPYKGVFFEPNLRSVNHIGVDHVMTSFFASLAKKFPQTHGAVPTSRSSPPPPNRQEAMKSSDVVCEEELLNAFGGGGKL